jgi:DNA-binding transcriptional ArsR family regulator
MTEKYLLFNLEDEKAKKLGEAISNPTARKIVNFLAEREASETEISKNLGLALNTVEYNLKKLLEAGIIEKSKNFFWSSKGKKIDVYKVANKLLVIAPKKSNIYSKLKAIIPVVLISAVFSFFIAWYFRARQFVSVAKQEVLEKTATTGSEKAGETSGVIATTGLPIWQWFLILIWIGIIIFIIWKLKKE